MKFDPRLINKSVGIHLFINLRRVILEYVLDVYDSVKSVCKCLLLAAFTRHEACKAYCTSI